MSSPTQSVSPDSRESQTDIIQIDNLEKAFGQVKALQGVDLNIKDGEIIAIIGDNGAGKSTFVNTITGVLQPTDGKIKIRKNGDMVDETHRTPNNLETVFQDLELSDNHTVASNIFMGREPQENGLLKRLCGKIDRERMERESVSALKKLGMPIDPNADVEKLSGGQRQAVAIARALVSDPTILILDEPTAEVSIEGREKILNLMRRLNNEDRTILFITHNLEEVFDIADRVAVFRDGKVANVLPVNDNLDRRKLVGMMTGAIK